MARVPIVRIGDTLVATVQEDLRDREALGLRDDLAGWLERTGAQGVLLDVSTVETVDSFLGRLINDIATSTRLLGAHTVVVGIQPAVALTLIELGLELRGVRTALNPEKGMKLVKQLIAEERQGDHRRGP